MTSLIAALDVHYEDRGPAQTLANAACVLFADWQDPAPSHELCVEIPSVLEYRPGHFYKRELPCLLAALEEAPAPPTVIIVDGHVWLESPETPGLGAHLYAALDKKTPVIGVAKSAFKGSSLARKVLRGESQNPLFITAVGIDQDLAADHIASMAGAYRMPTLLKRVDSLARGSV